MVDLDTVPDVLGLTGRRPEVAVARVLQGWDERSVRTLIPDPRVQDSGFHDVTIIDMEDSAEPAVSEDDLSLLRLQWPVTVLRSMVWLQSELDAMRAAAKRWFRNSRPADCSYCGKWIKCDIYHHVSTFHMTLGQLWRCPVSWCTVWKGTPQDCMDHVRGAHDVPSDIKSTDWSHHGLSCAGCGWMPSNPVTLGCPQTFFCSVKHSSLWFTTTGCSRGVCPIRLSTGTTSAGYVCSSHRHRPWPRVA